MDISHLSLPLEPILLGDTPSSPRDQFLAGEENTANIYPGNTTSTEEGGNILTMQKR